MTAAVGRAKIAKGKIEAEGPQEGTELQHGEPGHIEPQLEETPA